jgi:flagella basal body P-ring formation protein FlgA
MMRKTVAITIIIVGMVFSTGPLGAGVASADHAMAGGLRIYLPREIVIEGNTPSLGQIGIIHGDESLVAMAGEIVLGRISVPGQEVTVDRMMLLSRLACNGIPASKIQFSGAEKVKVRQRGHTVKADDLIESARLFLGKNPPAGSIGESELLSSPKDLLVAGVHSDIKLVPRIVPSGAGNQTRIDVSVMSGGKEIASRRIIFRHKYNGQKLVALADIGAGEVISKENVKVEKTVSSYSQAASFSAPYGLIARCHIPKDAVVYPNMAGPAKPVILVKRNQSVVIRINSGGLVITAVGRMVDEGGVGDVVRVRNVDSQRVIAARVNEDGTVGPIL